MVWSEKVQDSYKWNNRSRHINPCSCPRGGGWGDLSSPFDPCAWAPFLQFLHACQSSQALSFFLLSSNHFILQGSSSVLLFFLISVNQDQKGGLGTMKQCKNRDKDTGIKHEKSQYGISTGQPTLWNMHIYCPWSSCRMQGNTLVRRWGREGQQEDFFSFFKNFYFHYFRPSAIEHTTSQVPCYAQSCVCKQNQEWSAECRKTRPSHMHPIIPLSLFWWFT